MTEHRTAYWTRQPRSEQPACWTDGCQNQPADEPDPRWRGTYCEPCQTSVLPSLVYVETNDG